MELIIHKPKEEDFVQSIEFNYDELKVELQKSLEKYKGITYNDEQIKIAKQDRAKLNKFKNALNEKKKDLKKKCLEPYEAFEVKIKELMGMVDDPIDEIDKQIKSFEFK